MVHRLCMIALLTLAASAHAAQVYRWVGPDGTVHFSDQARPGAESLQVEPVTTVPRFKVPPPAPRAVGTESPAGYTRLAFLQPHDDEPVRSNSGTVRVRMALEPALKPGHRLEVSLDGEPIGGSSAPLSFELPGLARGTHMLAARVVDAAGEMVAESAPVSFHVLRASLGAKPNPQP